MTAQTRPVLVGIDGTAAGLEALALGSAFAVLTGSPLVLGAVYGFEGGSFAGGLVWPPRADADRWIEEAGRRLGDAIPWSSLTALSTSVAHGLITLAKGEGAGMLVLGSSRRGPVGRVLAGSCARRAAHGAPCAVAVVPHGWRIHSPDRSMTVGAAVTDSPESRDALALAARLAAAAHAVLRVITSVHVASPAHPMFAATGTSYSDWRRGRIDDAERVAREAVETVAPEPDPEVVVLPGDPLEQLTDASNDLDLLVVGSRRYGPLRSALLGGVSSHLIERAACPVIIVPRGVPTGLLLDPLVAERTTA